MLTFILHEAEASMPIETTMHVYIEKYLQYIKLLCHIEHVNVSIFSVMTILD